MSHIIIWLCVLGRSTFAYDVATMDHKAAVDNEFRRGQTRAFWWAFPVFMIAFLFGAALRLPLFILLLLSGIPALIVYLVKLHGSFNADNVIRDTERDSDASASGPTLPQTPQTQARQQGAQFSTVSSVGRSSLFCINCGTESPDDSRFCSKCGTRLDVVSAVREPNTVRQECVQDLLELSEYLAASFVALSGEKSISVSEVSTQEDAAFETLEDMIRSGFMPRYGLSAQLSVTPPGEDAALDEMRKQFDPAFINVTAGEIRRDELFGPAFRVATAFLCFCVDHFSRTTMAPNDWDQFNNRFQSSVARFCAGRFGFDPEPRNAFKTIQELIPLFCSKEWINAQTPGKDDCLGKILNYLGHSHGQTRYAFLVGSHERPRICAVYVHAVARMKDAAALPSDPPL